MGLIVSASLFAIVQFPNRIVMISLFLFDLLFLSSFYFYVKKTRAWKEPIGILTLILLISQIGLISIIEHSIIRLFVIILSGSIFGILYGGGVSKVEALSALQKPYRRFVMSSWVIAVYGTSSTIFALNLFIPLPMLFVVLLLIGGIIMGLVASFVWQMYFNKPHRAFLLWIILMAFIGMELIWALHLLPLAYLSLGLLTTWVWYVIVLFARFHYDEVGIRWKEQMPFLLTNVVSFAILLLFFVRWI